MRTEEREKKRGRKHTSQPEKKPVHHEGKSIRQLILN